MKRVLVALALVVVAVVGTLGWLRLGPRHAPGGQPPLLTLSDLQPMRDDFGAHDGEVRVLALLSPT